MSSINAPIRRELKDLLIEIDSYASLLTKDFVSGGRRITHEFEYCGEKHFIVLPEGGIRFSVEVTEIFRTYLTQDQSSPMNWTTHFNTKPDIRQKAITEAYNRLYPPDTILPSLSPIPPTAAKSKTSLPRGSQNLALTGSPPTRPPVRTPEAPSVSQLNKPSLPSLPSLSKYGRLTFPAARS